MAALISIGIAVVSLMISLLTFSISKRENAYSDIDQQYFEILRIGLEYPQLRDHNFTSNFYKCENAEEKKRYDTYAYMCWNLMETIYDRQKDRRGKLKLSKTWIPVIIEENKLHYTWFKHNLRLFKEEFQQFVTSRINDIDIVQGSIVDLDMIYSRMERDFPADERKDRKQIEKLMGQGNYKLILARHRVFNDIIGYAFIHVTEEPRCIWLDYMAIDKIFQNEGYGTLLFNKLLEKNDDSIGMFIEVEKANSNNAEELNEQKKRIAFYERLGTYKLDIDYLLPTVDGDMEIDLYFRPLTGINYLPGDLTKNKIKKTFNFIHGDIPHAMNVFEKFQDNIDDIHF